MKKIGTIAKRILEALQAHHEGLTIEQLRNIVDPNREQGNQEHFGRRLRELYPFYIIDKKPHGRDTLYSLVGERPAGQWEYDVVNKTLRAKILARDGSRCQMCGKTVEADKIKLHIDHKIPQNWGGRTVEENLWALCTGCNEGKKNYFATFDSAVMKAVMSHDSVHKRIAELLHLKEGEWVDSDLIEFVANYNDWQTDWRKRLRELRYLGLKIEPRRIKIEKRTMSQYKLTKWVDLPADPSRAAQEYERARQRAK